MSKPKRIILDFGPDLIDRVESMQEILGVTSRTSVIRLALGLLFYILSRKSEGYAVHLVKDGTSIEVVGLFNL